MWRPRRLSVWLISSFIALVAVPAGAGAAPGDLDATFGTGGVTSLATGTALNGVAVAPDRSVVAVGSSGTSLLVQQFSATGTRGATFAAGSGVGRAVVLQSDGKIVVAGNDATGMIVERFNFTGGLDSGFGSGGVVHGFPHAQANAVALGPNGTIVAAGRVPGSDGFQRIAVLRLTSSGSADASFGPGGARLVDLGQDSIAKAVAVQGDGKIVLAGSVGPGIHQTISAFAARLTPAGGLDPTFASGGVRIQSPAPGGGAATFNAVALDPSGGIAVAGGTTTQNQSAGLIGRLTCAGAYDPSFAGGLVGVLSSRGFVTNPYGANGVAVLTGRRLVAAGDYKDSGVSLAALWGFEPRGSQDFAKLAPQSATALSLAVDSAGNLVVAGDNVPTGFAPSGFVARYSGFGAPASGTSPCGGVVTPPVLVPTLSSVSQAHRRWGEVKSKRYKGPVGTSFSFSLDVPARVTVTITQTTNGRRVKGRCVAQTRTNRKSPGCKLTRTKGSLSVNGKAGKNTISFKGTVSGRKLTTGSYTATVVATSSTGHRSRSQSLNFTIVK